MTNWQPADPTERDLLQHVLDADGDPEPRRVYADWLAERDDPRAELLRLIDAVATDPEDEPAREQLAALRYAAPPAWLALVDLAPIVDGSCPERRGVSIPEPCPLRWDHLERTHDANVRHCRVCDQKVYRCDTEDEARQHASLRRCVALALPTRAPRLRPAGRLMGRLRPPSGPRRLVATELRVGQSVRLVGGDEGTIASISEDVIHVRVGNRTRRVDRRHLLDD